MAIWAALKSRYPHLTEDQIEEAVLHLDGLYAPESKTEDSGIRSTEEKSDEDKYNLQD